jgi:glycosyltransferase involved in cell wall biosynthesis
MRRPEARLTIAGRDMERDGVLGSASAAGVEFIGRVADLEGLYSSAKVVIVPIFYGSGVPNKFLEALAANAGIILTSHVMRAVGSPEGLRAIDHADAWRDAVVLALDDPGSARVDPEVRMDLLADNGPSGFDAAMRTVLCHVRGLRFA